jgi:hypothetical protein
MKDVTPTWLKNNILVLFLVQVDLFKNFHQIFWYVFQYKLNQIDMVFFSKTSLACLETFAR